MIGNSLEQGSAFCQALDSKHFGLCEPQGHNYSTLQMQPQTECMYVNKQVQIKLIHKTRQGTEFGPQILGYALPTRGSERQVPK